MKPLKVTVAMMDGRIASVDGRFHLDSFLAYAWMVENYPERVGVNSAVSDEAIDPDLSGFLDRRGKGEDWYWACSFGQYSSSGEHVEYLHKRVNPVKAEKHVDFGRRRGRIVTAGGPQKSWRHPVVTMLIPEITWYCVGDAKEIERLLKTHIKYIGKHRAAGFGLIRQWIVEEWHEDWSEYNAEGKLMRAIPHPEGVEESGIRPPYWNPLNARWCLVPGVNSVV